MIPLELQILPFLYFFIDLSVLAIGGNFPSLNSPVNGDFSNYQDATRNPLLSGVKLQIFASPFSRVNIIATIAIILITVLNIIVYLLQLHEPKLKEAIVDEKSPLASERLLRRFSLPAIVSATHNFDDQSIIGRGGFGKVYKGVIDDGAITVAIKRLNLTSKQGSIEFLNEIEMLSKFRHCNLISLIGYCNDFNEMILVYEYMKCGALADHLYKIERKAALSWVQRLRICIEAARGLEYLHTGTNVIHRDMKSSNILLDENLTAKVSDFGISRIGPTSLTCSHVSTKIKGTRGYVDPEYLSTHKLTKKSDVYSFGVVLFEMLSGRAAVDLKRPDEEWGLVFWAQNCIKEEAIYKITDPSLNCQILPNSLTSYINIANRCVHYRSKKRPTMAEVVTSLESALALQEKIDSSLFDRDILSMGEAFGNQDKSDYSSVLPRHEGQINKTGQEIVLYSDTQHDVNHSDNEQSKYTKIVHGSNAKSSIKTARIATIKKIMQQAFTVKQQPSTTKPIHLSSKQLDEWNTGESLSYKYSDIRVATDDFSDANILGDGGFGAIYKGKLKNGEIVAVKRLTSVSEQDEREFKNEVLLLSKLQHRNLVRLLGFCLKGSERLVIYEFVPNASLSQFIFVPLKSGHLDWNLRYKIIASIARGLLYLHEDSRFRIFHCSIKASNILLDAEMTPKITNFGTALLVERGQTDVAATLTVQHRDIVAPEYKMCGRYSAKSDVFSFGLLVLEILSGQFSSVRFNEGNDDLRSYAYKHWKEKKCSKMLDPVLREGSGSIEEIMRCLHIALLCVQENAVDRPTMGSVFLMLNKFSLTLPVPSEPMHFNTTSRSSVSSSSSSNSNSKHDSLPSETNSISNDKHNLKVEEHHPWAEFAYSLFFGSG